MKIISFILILVTFSLNIMSQTKKIVYEKKGKVETYKITTYDGATFISNVNTPNIIIDEEVITKYKVWPKRTLINDKEYVNKYLKSKINRDIMSSDYWGKEE